MTYIIMYFSDQLRVAMTEEEIQEMNSQLTTVTSECRYCHRMIANRDLHEGNVCGDSRCLRRALKDNASNIEEMEEKSQKMKEKQWKKAEKTRGKVKREEARHTAIRPGHVIIRPWKQPDKDLNS